VLSLGVDAAAADPESPLQVTTEGYREAGRLIGALAPVAAIQEGGYDLPSLGEYVLATLSGLADGRTIRPA
jgi:acetoin utilization deacetylase AcuC-like enzyme